MLNEMSIYCGYKIGMQTGLFLEILSAFIMVYAEGLLYSITNKQRVRLALIFTAIYILGKYLCSILLARINPDIYELNVNYSVLIYRVGQLLIMVAIISFGRIIFDKKCKRELLWGRVIGFISSIAAVGMLFIMPVIQFNSVLLSIYILLIILLNCAMYSLYEYIIELVLEKNMLDGMLQQVSYQQKKYEQLSVAYKNTRRIVHDVKKHYLMVKSYTKNQQYDDLQRYLESAVSNIEAVYMVINTGNLVIDTFLSIYSDMAKNKNIEFNMDIHIDPLLVPVQAYDLCIIIGNILDNSMDGCINCMQKNKKINVRMITKDNKFVIVVSNSYVAGENDKKDELEHGYGIKNVNNVVEKYYGLMEISAKELFEVSIIIPSNV
jgi:sensor histidine kinase YesM